MDVTAFFHRIKDGSLSGTYLLHGEEEYSKESALRALYASLDDTARELNLHIFESAEAGALIDACETLPFFSPRRIVVCKALPKAEDWERIAAYLPAMPESSLLIFTVRGNAPGTLGMVKALQAQDRIVACHILEPHMAAKWVQQQSPGQDVTITPQAARFLVELVGCSLCDLNNEFIKAASYAGAGHEVTREIIAKAVSRNIEYGVFTMANYFMAGKPADGLRALDELLTRESAFSIAALMASRFKQMLEAKLHMEQGLDKKATVAKLGGSVFAAQQAYDAAKRYAREELAQNVIAFSNVGYAQITGKMKDVDALTQAVLRCGPRHG